jgi:hypothetical protein
MPPAPPDERAAEMLEQWEEEVIKSLLGVQGRVLHAAIGVSEQDWVHTDVDLAAIAPPLTRICNRYEPVRRYARHADPVTLLTGLAAYATRSLLERRDVLAALAEDADTMPIAPAEESPVPTPEASAPATPPRQASNFPTTLAGPPPMQPSEGPEPPPPPRPAEAEVDPTAVDWQVGG